MKGRLKGLFKKAGKELRTADHITCLLMALVICVSVFSVTASAGPGGDGGSTEVNTNIGGIDMTISRFSEIIAGTFSDNIAQSINHDGATSLFMNTADRAPITSGLVKNQFALSTVGNVLAYPGERDTTSNASNIWTDGVDAASKMMTLESLWSLHDAGSSSGEGGGGGTGAADLNKAMRTSAMAQYIVWGSALNSMGVDEFRDADSTADGIRMVIGYATYIFFILAFSASNIMYEVVRMLRKLNVFMWVWEGLKGVVGTLTKNILGVSSFEQVPLINEIIEALKVVMSLRWVLLGLMVLFFIASITVWKTAGFNRAATVQQKGRKIFYRLIIMCIGVPLCGMMYTECLDVMPDLAKNANRKITSYIFQEFMNFEGWTTQITSNEGALLSFRTGRDSADTLSANKYSKITVKYETDGQRFSIKAGTGDDAKALDINRFVYAVNEAVYGTDVTGSAEEASYLDTLYGKPESAADPLGGAGGGTSASYSDIIDATGTYEGFADDNVKEAYNKCRDLLLNYARSNTVKPDTLNSYYLSDMKIVAGLLYKTDDTSDSTAANEAAAANATVLEQLFGVNAAEQRIWSFVELNSPWIYPASASAKNIELMSGGIDGTKITAELSGLTAASSGVGANRVKLVKSGGGSEGSASGVIMGATLSNEFKRQRSSGDPYSAVNNIYATTSGDESVKIEESGNKVNNYVYEYTYNLNNGGMSPLSMYNYMHSRFENGTLTVYSPKLVSNSGISTMHYAVTTPYSGIPELVQLLFTIAVLFSLGIIGWVFGVSLLINSIVQMCKALPIMVKMMIGSIQGFVEGLLIVFSVAIEMCITLALYSLSVYIIDFLIRVIKGLATLILSVFGQMSGGKMVYVDPETYSIVAGLLSTAVILWGTFNLLKWRVAITTSIKSMVTHFLNQIFGTSAAMPTGADSKLLKAGAALAAGGMIAGSLAEQGTLDDVVNDLTQSDLGTSMHDKISEGDWDGAMEDLKSYADGTYVSGEGDLDRGVNAEDEAQKLFGDGADSLDGTFSTQSLTDEQQQELDDKYKDDALAAAGKLDEARKNGTPEDVEQAQSEFEDIMEARAADAAQMRAENGEKARELGVPDYGEYLRNQKAAAEAKGLQPIEGADIPDEPEKELTSDARMAYDAARDGDAETLRSAAGIYDANGLTAEQAEKIDHMVAEGKSEAEIAEAVEGFAEENFGENHAAVVDKMNEAAGRSGGALYGSTDNSDGNARTVAVASGHAEDGSRAYGVRDNSSDEGPKTFTTGSDGELQQRFDSELPADPGQNLSAENQAVYDAAVNGDQDALAAAAEDLDENGLTDEQAAEIDDMVASGASASAIAAQVDEYANENLGANHKAVMERVNAAAGRDNTAEYGKGLAPSDRTVAVRAKDGSMSGEGSDWGVTDGTVSSVANGHADESTFQSDGKGGAVELPSAISDTPSKDLSASNQAIFEAARDGDTAALQQAASQVNEHGLTAAQQQAVTNMVASGASEAEVAAAIDNFAQDNFGDDYKQVVDSINGAAGRSGSATYAAATGGGEDGTQPRAMSVEAGYANGVPSYSVDDLGTEEGAHMVQVSDENGQSIYKDTMPSAGGEQIVTSDFGQFDGQTYGSIRNEVDAVANASGGMLQRGSGSGDTGRTTVSEAASEIAARQSRTQSGGKAKAVVGSSGLGAEGADISAFNKAAAQAVENTGMERGSVAGIAGTVNKDTGMAVNTLPTAADMQTGLDGQPAIGLDGKPIEMPNSGTNGTTAQMIAAQSVDSYGRTQNALANDLGVTVAPAQNAQAADIPVTAFTGESAVQAASNIPAVPASGQTEGAPTYYDANGNTLTASVSDNGAMTFTDGSGKSVSPASVYTSTAASDGLTMYTQGDAPVNGSVNRDGSMTLTDANGKKVSASDVIQEAQADGIQFHNANGQAVQAVANRNGTMGFVDGNGRSISADQVFASAPVDHSAAVQAAAINAIPTAGSNNGVQIPGMTDAPGSNAQMSAPTNIPGAIPGTQATAPAYSTQGTNMSYGSVSTDIPGSVPTMQTGPADVPGGIPTVQTEQANISGGIPTMQSGPANIRAAESIPIIGDGQTVQYDSSGSIVTPSVSNGVMTYTNEAGQQVDPGSVFTSAPASSGGVQLYTAQDMPVNIVPNSDGTVSFQGGSGQSVAPGEVIQAAKSDGVAFHTTGGQFVEAVDNGNGTVSFVDGQGSVVPTSDVQISAPSDHNLAAQAANLSAAQESSGFTKADVPMALGVAAAAMTFVKTGNLSSAAMAYTGTKSAANDVVNRVSGPTAVQPGIVQAAPSGGNQVIANGPAATSGPAPAYNVPGMQATNTAAVQTVTGGTLTVARGGDGAIRTVDGNGAVTSQIVAMTSNGQYQTISQTRDGTFRTSGTGERAVQTTDGSYVVVTQDGSGNTVMADSNGGSSGTILTRTTDGYQPAVMAGNGTMYSVNENGQATGSVVVKSVDGGGVSVIRHTDGSVRMADASGGATNVVMASLGDGTYAPVGNTGRASLPNGRSVQVVTLNDGSKTGVVQDGAGGWFVADRNGKPSPTPVVKDDSGRWSAGTYAGSEIRDTTTTNTTTTVIHEKSDQKQATPQFTFGPTSESLWNGALNGWPQNPSSMFAMQNLQFMEYMQQLQSGHGTQGAQKPGTAPTDGQTGYQPLILNPDATTEGEDPEWSTNGGTWDGSEDRG